MGNSSSKKNLTTFHTMFLLKNGQKRRRNQRSFISKPFASIVCAMLFISTAEVFGQSTLNATRLSETSTIALDGLLDEQIWMSSDKATDFIQYTPVDGGVPTQPTEVSVAYDDQYLWVGVMAYEQNPDSIVAPIFRRDGVMGNGLMDISRDFGDMFDHKPINILLIKLSYWFGV